MTQFEYIAKRNSLIPQAEKYADSFAGPRPKENPAEWGAIWNKFFFGRMDELSKAEGLI